MAGNSPDSTHYSSCGEWDRLSGYRSSVDGFETPRGYDTDYSSKSFSMNSHRPSTSSSSRVFSPPSISRSCPIPEKSKSDDDGGASYDDDQCSGFDSQSELDSMFGDATDDDEQHSSSHVQTRPSVFYGEQNCKERYNPLLLNSENAFGAGDWEEFAKEVERTGNFGDRINHGNGEITGDSVSDNSNRINSKEAVLAQKHYRENFKDNSFELSSLTGAADERLGRVENGLQQLRIVDTHHPVSNLWQGSNEAEPPWLGVQREDHSHNNGENNIPFHKPSAKTYHSSVPNGNMNGLKKELNYETMPMHGFKEEIINKEENGESSIQISSSMLSFNNVKLEYPLEHVTTVKSQTLETSEQDHKLESTEQKCISSQGKSHDIQLINSEDKIKEKDDLGPDEVSRYVEAINVNESYVDTVLDMEEVLLDSGEGRGGFTSKYSRDESLVPSTSGRDSCINTNAIHGFDGIEVVGAKQKRGSSIGERLVGVKEYTVYQIRVRSGKFHWEVERRYRDFLALYRQLKKTFSVQRGMSLPSPWHLVEKETYKIFGNASPTVVNDRSILIQNCLVALIQSGSPFNSAPPLFWFLSPQNNFSDIPSGSGGNESLQMQDLMHGKSFEHDTKIIPAINTGLLDTKPEVTRRDDTFDFGKTIRLIVDIHHHKSVRQLLEGQHFSCAGCYRRFDVAKSLAVEFAQVFGWGKPRLCEYTGQLFCTTCHQNETAVLPARVLHHWDFSLYPVSQLAKAYLDSIYDQPMLCVSAVNPLLFSRVPLLVHVVEIRRKLCGMLSHIRCPSRSSIQQAFGSRRYLLEASEFFALRDLVDLSKGVFAALPSLMENLSKKVYIHITQKCSICQEGGQFCGVGKTWCEMKPDLVFPFQESKTCNYCGVMFHLSCFKRIGGCQCSATSKSNSENFAASRKTETDKPEKETVKNESSRNIRSFSNISLHNHESSSSKGSVIDYLEKAVSNVSWKGQKKSALLNMAPLSMPPGLS